MRGLPPLYLTSDYGPGICQYIFSALTLLVGRQEGHPACMVICLERGADLHMALLMPLPLTVSCFSKIQIGFTFLVPAHLGSPGKRAVKRVCCTVCEQWAVVVCQAARSRHSSLLLAQLLPADGSSVNRRQRRSMAERAMLDSERQRAIALYRQLKTSRT